MKKVEESTAVNVDDNVNILDVIFRVLRYWKLILLIVTCSLILGVCYIFITPKKYMATTSILLMEEGNAKAASGGFDLESMGLLTTTNNIDNEIALLTSPDIMLRVVDDLKLYCSYYIKDKFREIDIYKNSPYLVSLDNDSILSATKIELSIVKENKKYLIRGRYSDYGNWIEISKESTTLPVNINIKGANVLISLAENSMEMQESSLEVFVDIQNPISVADSYASILNVSTVTKFASTLSLDVISSNADKGKDVLLKLIEVYNLDNVRDKNMTALNAAVFINERIADIGVELGDVEKDVENFKKNQGITDISNEAQVYMQQYSAADGRLLEIETQIKIVEMVETFIKNSNNKTTPIPNIGLVDAGLSASILEYNNKILNYNPVLSTTNEDNPTRIRVLAELEMLRESILDLIENMRRSQLIAKTDLEKQVSQNLVRIKSLPSLERGLLEKMRQQQIKENLYLFLLQKREESNIMLASNSDKAKVVIKPRSTNIPVIPNNKMVLLVAFVLGLIISLLVVYARSLFYNKIEDKEDLARLSDVPVIGTIIKNDGSDAVVVKEGSDSPISELFRYLRNKIEFVLGSKENQVVLVTSTISGEGKTFVSVNLASAFALNNKKVLLLGMDVRNPQLATAMGFSKSYGLTDYISGNIEDWRTLLVQVKDNSNLSVLQAGTIPPNPNELLKSKRIRNMIDEMKSEYDLVVIDSAPLGIISDTYALSEYTDFTLYVVRENVTFKSSVKFLNEEYAGNQFSNMYVLLNGSTKRTGSYSYYGAKGYGYAHDSK